MSLPLLIVLIGSLAALVGYAIWEFFQPPAARPNPLDDSVREMTENVQAIGETVARINAAHKAAYGSVEAAPPDGNPRLAYEGYIRHAPDPRLRYDFEVLKARFTEGDHPAWVAVIAGLALREMLANGSDFHLRRDAVRYVFEHGTPEIVEYLAEGLSAQSPGVDQWIRVSGKDRVPQATIDWIEPLSQAIASRLRHLSGELQARHRALTIAYAEWVIGNHEPFDVIEDIDITATELAELCMIPYAEIGERVAEVVQRRSAHPDWRRVRLGMDLILIEGGRHTDLGGTTARLEYALEEADDTIVDHAGRVAADLIEHDRLDESFRTRMGDAIGRVRGRYDPLPQGLLKLEAALARKSPD